MPQILAATSDQLAEARREISVMSKVDHDNILPLLASAIVPTTRYSSWWPSSQSQLDLCSIMYRSGYIHIVLGKGKVGSLTQRHVQGGCASAYGLPAVPTVRGIPCTLKPLTCRPAASYPTQAGTALPCRRPCITSSVILPCDLHEPGLAERL